MSKTEYHKTKSLAEQGDAEAQSNLGSMYFNGQGVKQDDKQAAQWFRLAAEQSHVYAQFDLGLMYKKGRGVKQDDEEAEKWHSLAAKQGLAGAQVSLGLMYYNGDGVPKDYIRAYMWLNTAISQGHDKAKKVHDRLAQYMSADDIATAQNRAKKCIASNYKNC